MLKKMSENYMTSVAILAANRTKEIHMIFVISFAFPVISFSRTQEIMPNMIPLAIEYVNGMMTMAR